MQLYRYFVSQSSEFCRHNSLCCFWTSVCCCLFRYDSGNFWIHPRSAEVNVWICTPTAICPYGMVLKHRDNFTLERPNTLLIAFWKICVQSCELDPVVTLSLMNIVEHLFISYLNQIYALENVSVFWNISCLYIFPIMFIILQNTKPETRH
jgi:hypothetical protein